MPAQRRRHNLLNNQRPKARLYRDIPFIKWALIASCTVLASFVIFVIQLRYEAGTRSILPWIKSPSQPTGYAPGDEPDHGSTQATAMAASRPQWQVSMITTAGEPLPPATEARVLAACQRFLRTAHRDELHFIAEYLMRESAFDRVILRRGNPREITIELSSPYPVAIIKADTLRFVSSTGVIFGRVHAESPKTLTLLSGIFTDSTDYHLSAANKLIVSAVITTKIRELLAALELAKTQNLTVTSLHHHPFRGLMMELKDHTKVVLGHAPFAKKIARLQAIFDQAENSQQPIKKIELDYKGKAFIKTGGAELSAM